MLLSEILPLPQVLGLVVVYVVLKISSVSSGKFSIPHSFLNGIKVIIPTRESLEAMNPVKPKKKAKDAAPRRKYRTVLDRINAMEFEQESIKQGQLMRFAGWDVYDNMVIIAFCSAVGILIVEGEAVLTRIGNSISSDCEDSSQVSLHASTVITRLTTTSPLLFLLYTLVQTSSLAPHYTLWNKAKSRFIGAVFAVFFFWFMNTPVLEQYLGLPLSSACEDFAVRMLLFFALFDRKPHSDLSESLVPDIVKLSLTFVVFFLVTGFVSSLSDFAKVSAHILRKDNRKFLSMKVAVILSMVLPLAFLVSYVVPENANFPAVLVRGFLATLWLYITLPLIRSHLQIYLEQSIVSCAHALKFHSVDVDKIMSLFTGRAELIMYSVNQFACFPLFVMGLLFVSCHRTYLGALPYAPAYFGGLDGKMDFSRSPVLDSFQFAGHTMLPSTICSVPPHGAYPDELKQFTQPSPHQLWDRNFNDATLTLQELWDELEDLNKKVDQAGGYGNLIFYHNSEFDASRLATKQDKANAEELRKKVKSVKALVSQICFHTFLSPSVVSTLIDCLAATCAWLWIVVYCLTVVSELFSPNALKFEISDAQTESDANDDKKRK